MKKFVKAAPVLLLLAVPGPAAFARPDMTAADSVRAEFLHAWNGYKKYAWGHDALKPLTKTYRDWYAASLLMTPVDAYDGLLLMGCVQEAAEAKKLILDSLSFDRNFEVQSFEVTIRLLGGLLAAYDADGDPRFLGLAEDLGQRLLPVFNSPTGMPYRFVNLRTGAVRDSINNPAEIGTALLEFGILGKRTGKSVYYEKAKKALVELFRRRSDIGLVGEGINVETGAWTNPTSHIGGGIDSYYEYLLKGAILFGDAECRDMWESSYRSIQRYIADSSDGRIWYGQADMSTGTRTGTTFGSLEAFFPAVLCLAGDIRTASRLQESCFAMWNLYGIEPEEINYRTMAPTAKGYYLRPEIIESAFYLYRTTGDPRYRDMGESFFHGLMASCRTDDGYAFLSDVTTKTKGDAMESFFLAETMKYLYLLFAPADAISLERIVFNTEAHPLKR